MNRFMKTTLAILIVGMFLLSVSKPTTPVAAVEQTVWDESVVENAMYMYNVTKFKTAAGLTEAFVSLGGGPQTASPDLIHAQCLPAIATTGASWANPTDFRNVIKLGLGYTLNVTLDTRDPAEEELTPGAPIRIVPLAWLPQNPDPNFNVVYGPSTHKVTILDTTKTAVKTADGAADAWLNPKFVQALILPHTQLWGTEHFSTFYEQGTDATSHWISFAPQTDGLGYWTLEFPGYSTALVPSRSEIGLMRTNVTSGITYSFEVLNQVWLAAISGSAYGGTDPVVELAIELVPPKPEVEKTSEEDSPGFELGIVLFSLVTAAALVVYHKKK